VMDERGRRPVLLAGGALGVLACAAYMHVSSIGPWLYLVRIAHGLSEAMLFASLFAVAADLVPPSRRIEGIGIFGVSGLVPMAVGGAAGDLLIERGGFTLLFGVATGLNVAALALSLTVREPPRTVGEAPRGLRAALVEPVLVPLWTGGLLFATALAAHFTFLKTMVAARASFGKVGDFFAAYALIASAIRVVAGSLPERVGPKRVLVLAVGSLAAGQMILAWASTRTELVVAGLLAGAGHGYTFPILIGLVVTRARANERGVALAIFTALFDAGTLVGGPLLGGIAKHADYTAMFLFSASLALAGMGSLWLLDRRLSAKR
jgi:MFS family permease